MDGTAVEYRRRERKRSGALNIKIKNENIEAVMIQCGLCNTSLMSCDPAFTRRLSSSFATIWLEKPLSATAKQVCRFSNTAGLLYFRALQSTTCRSLPFFI